jgi:peptidyl-prolyl cis-trans isomerase SurA
MFHRLILSLILLASLATATSAGAQDFDRVAAVVNDEAISLHDVIARVRLSLVSANIADNTDNRRRVLPQVMRKMIDERLQVQEANRLKISISAGDVDVGIGMIEQQNRIPKGSLMANLSRQGIDAITVRDQIRADLTWMRLMTRAIQPQIRIGEEEISDRLEIMRARQGQAESLLAEIYLPVDTAAAEDEAKRLGDGLIEQLRAGTPFTVLARQFSRAPTAANGGTMGWMNETGLDDEVATIAAKLTKGQVSPLTRTSSGFHIIALIDQRITGQSIDPEASTISYSRMVLPMPRGPGAPSREQLLAQAAKVSANAKTCAEFDTNAHRIGALKIERIGPTTLSALSAESRQILMPIAANHIAPPSETAEGIQVMMVCSREEATRIAGLTRDQIRRTIEDERLDMLSRRYLRDLRRQAFIDIRL